ncbi:MAG: hypothetical protein ICV83_26235 [Cytophagales bacterium]|nr:hypothetical protein [Cytophagales bacterium]
MGLNILICVDDEPNQDLTQEVSRVEVYEKIDQNTTYKLNFLVDVCSDDIARTLDRNTDPGTILSVVVQTDQGRTCLVKGPVTQKEAHLQHGGAGSWIHVEGEDTGYNMDQEVNFRVTPSGTDAEIVTQLISRNDHMTPDVEDTPDSAHEEENHSLVQREPDLSFIRSLARRNGYHFWITYTDAGRATGHFRSRTLAGEPAATLVVNLENYNIESLRISADTRRPTQTVGRQLNLRNKSVIGDTVSLDDTPLGAQSLAAAAGRNAQTMHLAPTIDDAGAMQARSRAALRDAQWFIHATCRASLGRLSKVVRSHTIVNVQGAGSRHSGRYYVNGVKHVIDAAAHLMELELTRNAWGSE